MIFPVPHKVAVVIDALWLLMFLVTKDSHYMSLFLINLALLFIPNMFQK